MLDIAVKCGFLFHAEKYMWPTQVVKYLGLHFDTTSIPCLHIPIEKNERALVICEYLIVSPRTKDWSRLSLSLVAGTLESLVEATPRQLGNKYLCNLYHLDHPHGYQAGIDIYCTKTILTPEVVIDLQQGCRFLKAGQGRYAWSSQAATLVPTWGDGSGTGAGGTIQLPNSVELTMWKGVWKTYVMHFV